MDMMARFAKIQQNASLQQVEAGVPYSDMSNEVKW